MELHIRYRSSDDIVTERTISNIVLEPPNTIHAFCHTRHETRSFVLNRIELAVNLDTGEIISDIWLLFGLPSQAPKPLTMPAFQETPNPLSTEEAQRQRKTDKQALFRCFKYPVIAEAYKAKLLSLFGNRCFRCKSTFNLELDHHIPQFFGGRLVPGNIVLLCSPCNSEKSEKHPNEFYSKQSLEKLQYIFSKELELFNFQFNWSRWNHHPMEYLLSLGVSEENANCALRECRHPAYIEANKTEL